jgi:hypothetical protein
MMIVVIDAGLTGYLHSSKGLQGLLSVRALLAWALSLVVNLARKLMCSCQHRGRCIVPRTLIERKERGVERFVALLSDVNTSASM